MKPVVALESTVITHGMPYPDNVQTALAVEEEVRLGGAVPATVAIFGGKIRVGLSAQELHALGACEQSVKVASRDLAAALITNAVGGTTVSATMKIAHLAGIPVLCTGGIGGVHRDVVETSDISADLIELSRLPIAVVCAGVKAILDIPRTLEFLETYAVPALTLGINQPFPGFFFKDSGVESPLCFENEEQIAAFISLHRKLESKSGVLVAVPPPELDSSNSKSVKTAIEQSLKEISSSNIRGKAVTPYLLRRVNELSNGLALKTNIALLKNNARVASNIAARLFDLGPPSSASFIRLQRDFSVDFRFDKSSSYDVVTIGGASVDVYASAQEEIVDDGSTHHGCVYKTFGGVARNVADALTRLGVSAKLISAAGDDEEFCAMKSKCPHMDFSGVSLNPNMSTASYIGFFEKRRLKYGILNNDVYNSISPELVSRHEAAIRNCKLVLIDGNVPFETLSFICTLCQSLGIPIWFDPADRKKAKRVFKSDCWKNLTYFSPNRNEFLDSLPLMNLRVDNENVFDSSFLKSFIQQHCDTVLGNLKLLLLTLDREGIIAASKSQDELPQVAHYKAPKVGSVLNESGAGDCLNAGIIYSLLQGYPMDRCIQFGLRCVKASLLSHSTIPEDLSTLKK
ncbi:Indigoidine A and PfkB domain containing protein [Trichuris trichiura]|uniref:Indigoidine A and PfkB domain containing protein n=1 Tax=Trichuris trichiura TaxID=36087 RepID=A0A077Z0X7_TRITR|nr:Indigoidine A and PfkB domain containing protein [Trichuris trichiura]